MSIYKVPFKYPDVRYVSVTHLRDLLNEHDVKLEYNFDADFDDPLKHTITGDLDGLTGFMSEVMSEGARESFDALGWRKTVSENYEWKPNGLGPNVGCYS